MSLASQLEALRETYENKNATLRILFEQRLDTLRNNIISFIGNALHDETAKILNQSETTRAFVVDRILEVVSDNLESEKETTISKLITKINQLTKTNNILTIENKELKSNNEIFENTQKNVENNSEEVNKLKQIITEKEHKMKTQTDKVKTIKDELQIKTHEFDRLQSQNDDQHEQIQKLHSKLENTLKNLQTQQIHFDKRSIENKQFKNLNEENKKELKQCNGQVNCLKTSLMKSESERLILRKQYMEIGNKLEEITNKQSKQMKEFEKQNKNKNNTISSLKHKIEKLLIEKESLNKKLNEQSHSLCKKMKKELGKTKVLCDDVAILRKQLEAERNISKMYVDELQKLKMELNTKSTEINYNEKHFKNSLSSQKKKIHKYYQKMIDSNMIEIQNEYKSHIQELKEQYEEALNNIQNYDQQEYVEEQHKLLLKIKKIEKKYNETKEILNTKEIEMKECIQKLDECKSKEDVFIKEIEILTEDINLKDEKIKEITEKQNEEKESFQRLLCDKQKENEELTDAVIEMRQQKDNIQQNKFEDNSKANAMEYELKQNIEALKYELKKREKEYDITKKQLEHIKSNHTITEKFNWKYQEKLSLIREFCRNVRREMKNNKNEIEYMKSSISMHIERIFHELQISFNELESKSAKFVLKKERGLKRELTQSMKQLKTMQDLQLQSMEKKVKYAMLNANKINKNDLINNNISNKNMNKLDISGLENEVDIIKNELAQARNALSPKKVIFKKISMPSSISSSMLISPAVTRKNSNSSYISNKMSNKKVLKRKNIKYDRRESFDTATIRKLRNDLQNLESNFKYSKKQNKKKFSNSNLSSSLDSSSVILK